MRIFKRICSAFFLLALLTLTATVFAQDDLGDATAVGSGLALPLLEALANADDSTLTLNTTVTGTASGFEQFCAGEADLMTSNRAISVNEEALCTENEVLFSELLLAHEVLAVVANPTDAVPTCLTSNNLNTILAPSATGQFSDWSQLAPNAAVEETETEEEAPEQPVTLWLPSDNTLSYALLDELVDGLGFRSDLNTADVGTILDEVSATEGALGIVPLQALTNTDADVTTLELNLNTGCATPSIAAVETGSYRAASTFYLYVNDAVREALADYLTVIGSEAGTEIINTAGYSAISADASATNAEVVSGEEDGRAFTAEAATYTIPPVLDGILTIAGDPQGYGWANSVATQIGTNAQGQQQPNLTLNINTFGEADGVTAFCADDDEIDGHTLLLTDTAPEGDVFTCEASEEGGEPTEFEVLSVTIGSQATILIGNDGDSFNTCLTTEQIATIWDAAATDTVLNWSDVGESLPDQPLTLFGIGSTAADEVSGNIYTDLLLNPLGENIEAIVRADTEFSTDALFRAAATANVSGALTYMSWVDYLDVRDNDQNNIRFLAVDAGNGCSIPSEDAILNGNYPLSSSLTLVVRKSSLLDVVVQSYLWSLFSDSNIARLENDDFIGLNDLDLPDLREDLLVEYALAATAAAEAAAESEAETTAEAEATEEPSGD